MFIFIISKISQKKMYQFTQKAIKQANELIIWVHSYFHAGRIVVKLIVASKSLISASTTKNMGTFSCFLVATS